MRIFWPLDIPRTTSSGVIVGWKNSDLTFLLWLYLRMWRLVLSHNTIQLLIIVQIRNVESALKVGTLFRNAGHPVSRIFDLCGRTTLHVLGAVNSPMMTEGCSISASTSSNNRVPQITCSKAQTIQIIMFSRPLPARMQYLSINPISLALGDQPEQTSNPPDSMDAEDELVEAKNRVRTQALVEKLKLHTVTKHPPSAKEVALPRIVNQINCAWELHQLLQKNIALVGSRQRRSLSVSERVVESASSMRDYVVTVLWQVVTLYVYPIIRRGFIIGLMGHRLVAEALLLVLEWRADLSTRH